VPHCSSATTDPSFKRDTWGYFSAVCFLHGLELLQATGRPQGLLEASWGGTGIERWSSEAATARCAQEEPDELDASLSGGLGGNWAGMIAPLLPLPIRGVLWYQGEANSQNIARGNRYACQLQALIQDWRERFAAHPAGDATWVSVQLAAAGDSSGGAVRLAQRASTALSRTGLAVATDLLDQHSPCGSVHPRNKSAVARRAAKASLAMAYGRSDPWTGPLPLAIAATKQVLTIDFTGVFGELAFEAVPGQTEAASMQNFEVTSDTTSRNGWSFVSAHVRRGDAQVVVDISGIADNVAWVRYSWGNTPRGQFLYDNGGRAGLPAGPFMAKCDGALCSLVKGGSVPDPVPPSQPPVPTVANCSFQNSTLYKDEAYKSITVPLNDYAACCDACHEDVHCAVAQMDHGSGTMASTRCQLLRTALQPMAKRVSPPALKLACVPKRLSTLDSVIVL